MIGSLTSNRCARQCVLSFPFLLRFPIASRPVITGQVLGIVNRVITTHLVKKAGYSKKTARTGAVTLIQRFGSALNLKPNAARFTFICCTWMECMSTASMDQFDVAGSVHRPPRS